MLRQVLLLAVLILFAENLWATDRIRVCRFAYREATLRLIQNIEEFQNKTEMSEEEKGAGLVQLAVFVTNQDVELGLQRSSCRLFEPVENRNCVAQYKQIYDSVRGRIRTAALISQNQKEVKMSALSTVGIKAKLLYRDTLCDYSQPAQASSDSDSAE